MQSLLLESYWLWTIVHILGLVVACTARLSLGTRHEALAKLAFVAALVLVGSLAVFQQSCAVGCWHITGATFSVMVIAAVSDFSRTCEQSGSFARC